MRISLIVAVNADLLIGTETGLPWHLPADLRRFRKLTMGKPIIMGRKTREQIGRPLDGRLNIVLTTKPDFHAEAAQIVHSLEDALLTAAATGIEEVMIIGGGEIYHATLPIVERIHLTLVEGIFVGTTYFPDDLPYHPGFVWQITARETCEPDAKNPHRYHFLTLDKVPSPTSETQTLRTLLSRP